jgi:Fe-S-cluster containining protein
MKLSTFCAKCIKKSLRHKKQIQAKADKNKRHRPQKFFGCSMRYVPWSKIKDWFCTACGDCCKEFKVPLRAYEATLLSKIFGFYCMELEVGGTYLKRGLNGRCIFQVKSGGRMVCGIQSIKPIACKMWPFAVFEAPRYEQRNEASFDFRGETFFVYVNPFCRGLVYGRPSLRLVNSVIPEFIELRLGLRRRQVRSTSFTIKIPALEPKTPLETDYNRMKVTPFSPLINKTCSTLTSFGLVPTFVDSGSHNGRVNSYEN